MDQQEQNKSVNQPPQEEIITELTEVKETSTPEQEPPKKPKSKKALIWCLSILTVIALAAATVFAYLYFTQPKTVSEVTTVTEEINETETTEESSKNNKAIPSPAEIAKLLSDKYDLKEEDTTLCYGTKIACSMNDFDTNAKIQFTIDSASDNLFSNEKEIEGGTVITREIKYDDLNNLFQDYFSSSESIAKEDRELTPGGAILGIKYLPESDSFEVRFANGLGGTSTAGFFNKVVEVKGNEERFEAIVLSVIVNHVAYLSEASHLDYNGGNFHVSVLLPEEIDKIVDSLSAYRLFFTEENGEYKLTSIEKL